jgi:predicted transcriptional regulator of viral defense system
MIPERFLLGAPAFFTSAMAGACGMTTSATSRLLTRLAHQAALVRVTRGVWANTQHPNFTPYGLTPYLLAGEMGYVSFLSALQRHGVISQIPTSIYVATTGHARIVESPVGTFRFVGIKPIYMQHGVTWLDGSLSYGLAIAEKALIDCLYVSTRRGNQFKHLPEIESEAVDIEILKRLIRAHGFSKPIENYINKRCAELL